MNHENNIHAISINLCTSEHRVIFVLFLQVNAVDQDGLTPLHIASQQGHAETVIQLLQGGADPGAQDRLGRTALHWAASAQGQNPAVDLLLSARANPNTTDREKKTALHLAATQGNTHAVTSLLSHKVKGGTKDMDGSTPLHHAAACGHAAVVTALLHSLKNKGLEVRNVWRKTPLHAAAERGHDSVVELLLDAGANINAKDNSKDTPLHCAARGGHHEVVRRLRANLQATNNVGKTPLQSYCVVWLTCQLSARMRKIYTTKQDVIFIAVS
uniref:CARD- and ANK-containing Inflammasome Adaptor Protein n=1 Tax=Myripristis murdjan TaxID=586833 RepID=A0A667YT52_9TELE